MGATFFPARGDRASASASVPAQTEMPGGLRALAAVAALSTAATFAMTTTTALHVVWPNAAFGLLALALGAAVLLAHARLLSTGRLAFMAGVMVA